MPADEHLSGRQFLYHESHLSNRESIRETGLRPSKEWKSPEGKTIAPAGVYLSGHGSSEYGSSMNDSSHFGYDRWRVNVSDLPVHTDPSQPDSAHYTPDRVSPERLTLVKKGHPNWRKHI